MSTIPMHLVNEVMRTSKNEMNPQAGLMGTYTIGSDHYPVVIAKVNGPKEVFVLHISRDVMNQRNEVNGIEFLSPEIVSGLLEESTPDWRRYAGKWAEMETCRAMYRYDMDSFLRNNTFTLRKNGRWVRKGSGMWEGGGIHFGQAIYDLDPSF